MFIYTWRPHLGGGVTSRVMQGSLREGNTCSVHLEVTPGGIMSRVTQGSLREGNLCSVHLQVTPGGGGTSRVTPGSQQTAAGVQISISVKEEGCLHGVPGSLVPGCSHIPKSADAQFPHTKWVTSASALCTPSLA